MVFAVTMSNRNARAPVRHEDKERQEAAKQCTRTPMEQQRRPGKRRHVGNPS